MEYVVQIRHSDWIDKAASFHEIEAHVYINQMRKIWPDDTFRLIERTTETTIIEKHIPTSVTEGLNDCVVT